jgi:outer membrane protein TolC
MMRKSNILIILLLSYLAMPAQAQELSAQEVLKQSAAHLPTILKARLAIEEQRGAVQTARGAFDRRIEGSSDNRLTGYYDGQSAQMMAVQPIPNYNARFYSGYRLSNGDYPAYDGDLLTQSGGEVAVGAIFSLLRNRDIDSNRVALQDETLKLQQARYALELQQLEAQLAALLAYLEWVARGLEYGVRQDIWQIASKRQEAFTREVEAGNKAKIYLVENKQNMLKRKAALQDADRTLQNSAQALSFYYRDAEGKPQLPDIKQLPSDIDMPWVTPPEIVSEKNMVDALLATRPEVRAIKVAMERNARARALAENQLLPELDVLAEVSQDMGQRELVREDTESKVKLKLTIPLQTRAAEGKIRSADAKQRMLEQESAMVRQQLMIAVGKMQNDMRLGKELMEITQEEVQVAEALLAAERKRFREGGSDFFLLNIREETLAEARIKHVNATLRYMSAVSQHLAVMMQRDALMLAEN